MQRSSIFFVALLAAASVPVLFLRHLPLQDYPQQLLIARLLSTMGPEEETAYEPDLELGPYMGFYLFIMALERLIGVEAAGRAALLVYLVGTPLAVRAYLREVAPERAAALPLVIPALFTGPYYLGLAHFLMGVPAALAGLAALARHLRRPSWLSAVAYVAFAGTAYLCHAQAIAILLAASAGFVLLNRGRAWLLVLLTTVTLVLVTPFSAVAPGDTRFASPLEAVLLLIAHVACSSTHADAALWGIPLGAFLLASRREGLHAEDGLRRERFVLPALALALLFASPFQTLHADRLNMRFALFLFLCLPTLWPSRRLDFRARTAIALFASLFMAATLWLHGAFDREARSFDRVASSIPPGASVLPLMFDPRGEHLLWTLPYLHYGSYVHLRQGGLGAELFPDPHIPIRMKPGGFTGMDRFRHRPWLAARDPLPFPPDRILVRGTVADRWIPAGYRLLSREGAFAVYARLR